MEDRIWREREGQTDGVFVMVVCEVMIKPAGVDSMPSTSRVTLEGTSACHCGKGRGGGGWVLRGVEVED